MLVLSHRAWLSRFGGDPSGYFLASVTPKRMMLDLRFVTSVLDPSGFGYTERSWVVEDGVAGAISSS